MRWADATQTAAREANANASTAWLGLPFAREAATIARLVRNAKCGAAVAAKVSSDLVGSPADPLACWSMGTWAALTGGGRRVTAVPASLTAEPQRADLRAACSHCARPPPNDFSTGWDGRRRRGPYTALYLEIAWYCERNRISFANNGRRALGLGGMAR